MNVLFIVFAVIIVLLFVILFILFSRLEHKSLKQAEDYGFLKGRIINEPSEPLSLDKIEDSVKHCGYVPRRNGSTTVSFNIGNNLYFIDAYRLPRVFIAHRYKINTSFWDLDLLKLSAHKMSDDVIMVKALLEEEDEGLYLKFYIAAMDRCYSSFRDNLSTYISFIAEATHRMLDTYNHLELEKKRQDVKTSPYPTLNQNNSKVSS